MRKFFSVALAILLLAGCTSLENAARDTAATLQGLIEHGQNEYKAECQATPTIGHCIIINRAVDGQNALVSAIETYCGWPARPTPEEMKLAAATCQRISSAEQGLRLAVRNAQPLISDLKGVVKK